MILEQFQAWARTAPASGRADGIRVLVKATLYSDLGVVRRDAIRVLTEFLDDPSPIVRTALAEALAGAPHAPHHLILALADDQAEIAAIVLSRSSVLSDAELIDCAGSTGAAAQAAIAARRDLSEDVASALADVAAPSALAVLAGNRAAVLPDAAIRRMVERCGDHGELREALLTRPDLPPDVRVGLVAAATRALAAFVTGRNWMAEDRMGRVAVEARDRAVVTIAADGSAARRIELVAHLRGTGQLTMGLAFRAILSGRLDLFQAVLCELTGMPPARVDGLVRHCGSSGFAALYRHAGLPDDLLPAFRAALRAAHDTQGSGSALSLAAVERVLASCETINGGELDRLLVMLRRFEAEAARDEARLDAATRDAATEALLLADNDALPGHLPAQRSAWRPVGRYQAPRYTIDLAAIEAQLCAA